MRLLYITTTPLRIHFVGVSFGWESELDFIVCRQLCAVKWHFLAQTYLVLGTVYNIKLSKYFKTDNRQEPLNNLGISRGSYYLSHPLLGP